MDAEALRWMGVAPEQIAAALAHEQQQQVPEAGDFGVWEENWDTWVFFLSLTPRWDFLQLTMPSPGGGAVTSLLRKGLPRTEIESAARLAGVPRGRWPLLMADLLQMEQEVLRTDQQRRGTRL